MQPSLTIQTIIRQKLENRFTGVPSLQFQSVGGGSINETYRLTFAKHALFCKINSASRFPHLFEKERNGLQLLAKQAIIKTPGVIDCFEAEDVQVLLLEWIYTGERNEGFWKKFGEQLAAMHLVSNDCFGLYEDNYMGSVPQGNQLSADWVDFFIHQRLEPLIKVCTDKKLLLQKHHQQLERLYRYLPQIFDNKQTPSLVHGDLWSGNFMCNQASEPVLIDPAVYYGHPSVDLGMSTLFGGFRPGFYEAYHYHAPFPKNYEEQWQVSNLYPLLIHLYLFGSSYLSQIEQTLDKF
jgi:fructosamine-3-kinase